MAEDDVTVGEVFRAVQSLQRDMREWQKNFLSVNLYNSERDSLRDDIKDVGKEVGDLRTALELERNERIKAEQLREKADLEAEQRQNKAASERRLQWTLAIVGPIVAAMISVVSAAISLGLLHTAP